MLLTRHLSCLAPNFAATYVLTIIARSCFFVARFAVLQFAACRKLQKFLISSLKAISQLYLSALQQATRTKLTSYVHLVRCFTFCLFNTSCYALNYCASQREPLNALNAFLLVFRFCCRIHFGLLNLRLQALYGSTCTLYFFFYSKLMLIRFNNINLSKCWRGDVLRNAVTDLKNLIGKQTYGQIN